MRTCHESPENPLMDCLTLERRHIWAYLSAIIVAQPLVELFGMVFYLWWVPRRLFKRGGAAFS